MADAQALTVWPMRRIDPDAERVLCLVRDWSEHAAEVKERVEAGDFIAVRMVTGEGVTAAVMVFELVAGAGGLWVWVHQLAGDLAGVDLATTALRTVERMARGAGAVGMVFQTRRAGLVRRACRLGFNKHNLGAGLWSCAGKFQ